MPEPNHTKPTRTGLAILTLVLAFACWIHLPGLGHPYLPGWDEAIHAAVAANLTSHPFEPTLVDEPITPLNFRNWQDSHVWLHMPPMPFWQAAVGTAFGGRSFFWMRLPAFLLFLGTIICIYWLGLKLYGQSAGLLGATIFTASPFEWLQVQGYHFGDMTDVSLAFWLTLCAVSVERTLSTSKKKWMFLASISQAAALLSKSALALAPTGAILFIYLLPLFRFRLATKIKWQLPVIHIGLGLSGWAAWRLYAAHSWPMQWAHETKVQWLHVTTSYEGHGRSWDSLFNDLLGNLFTPALILLLLSASAYVFYLAIKRRRSVELFLVLWIAGTWIPLVLVKTKVPGVLLGIAPALALAGAVLILRLVRTRPGSLSFAIGLTPLIYSLLWERIPHGWFGFASKLAPDMAATPYLPTQIVIATCIWISSIVLFETLRLTKWQAPGFIGRILCSFFMSVAIGSVLAQQRTTRRAFEIIANFNPVLSAVNTIKKSLPEKSYILIEGTSNGRQRPALAASFLTGKPSRLVRSETLARLWATIQKKGSMVYLLTPIRRRAESLLAPSPDNTWWIYADGQTPPEPFIQNVHESFARYADGPDLLSFEPKSTKAVLGQQLGILNLWHAKGHNAKHLTKVILQPADGGSPIDPWPVAKNFPEDICGIHLHNLSPPGLLWGYRPLGTGMTEPEKWQRGWVVADRFFIWIPRHIKPGRYKLVQQMISSGKVQRPINVVQWPTITVVDK